MRAQPAEEHAVTSWGWLRNVSTPTSLSMLAMRAAACRCVVGVDPPTDLDGGLVDDGHEGPASNG